MCVCAGAGLCVRACVYYLFMYRYMCVRIYINSHGHTHIHTHSLSHTQDKFDCQSSGSTAIFSLVCTFFYVVNLLEH